MILTGYTWSEPGLKNEEKNFWFRSPNLSEIAVLIIYLIRKKKKKEGLCGCEGFASGLRNPTLPGIFPSIPQSRFKGHCTSTSGVSTYFLESPLFW